MMLNCNNLDYNQWEQIFPDSNVVCFGINNANHKPQDIHNFLMTYLDPKENYLVIARYNQLSWSMFYTDIATENREGIAVFVDERAIAYSNWYEHDKDASISFAKHEIEEIRCKCDIKGNSWQSYSEQTGTTPSLYKDMDSVDSEILVVYASFACSNESALELIEKKVSELGNITLAYLNYYGYSDKGFTYTWKCYQLPTTGNIENYEIEFSVKENQLSIVLVPNQFFYEGQEHACAFVDLQEWSIWLTQVCTGYGSGLSFDLTHELSHWILSIEYPEEPRIFIDWVHDTQNCYDLGYGCSDFIKVGNNAYTIMPKYK